MQGLRIVELAEGVAGEYCGKLLSDFGAEVIKVEAPGGSPVRRVSPFGQGAAPENSAMFAYLNTNKRSLRLDLDTAEGQALLVALIARADAVIDDHAPGWLARLGLDPARLDETHPDLVVCSITPFGQDPDETQAHAEDLTVFHASGWGYHTPSGNAEGRAPLKGAGRFVPSYEAAFDAALCVAAALYDRAGGGSGRFIDVSGQRVLYSRIDYVMAQMLIGDMDVTASHTAFDLGGPASILPCRDGFVYVWLSDETMWREVRDMIGDAPWMDEDFPHNWLQTACTPERVERTRRHLSEWLATQDKHPVSEEAQRRGVMIVPLNNPEDLIASPQFRHRSYFSEVAHPVLGTALYPTVPYRITAPPPVLARPAPLLGADTAELLAELTTTPGQ
ncbi:MAG TPA: CoA transferase, partial [Novosphingobium sp.]|nr:CoA transferase [Novosphingobium sp.]